MAETSKPIPPELRELLEGLGFKPEELTDLKFTKTTDQAAWTRLGEALDSGEKLEPGIIVDIDPTPKKKIKRRKQ